LKPLLRDLIGEESVSPPMRGRGLKHTVPALDALCRLSPPMRGRGLKPKPRHGAVGGIKSPPMRGRGLKHEIHRQG